MPNHPPKTLSYKDAKFIEETLRYCSDLVKAGRKGSRIIPLDEDLDRCIKILGKGDG